jgi:hypothetical protein
MMHFLCFSVACGLVILDLLGVGWLGGTGIVVETSLELFYQVKGASHRPQSRSRSGLAPG